MSKIRFEFSTGWSDCETCGSYDFGDCTMYVNDVPNAHWSWDTHLGGGTDMGELDQVKLVLEALGHEVEIAEERE